MYERAEEKQPETETGDKSQAEAAEIKARLLAHQSELDGEVAELVESVRAPGIGRQRVGPALGAFRFAFRKMVVPAEVKGTKMSIAPLGCSFSGPYS